MDFVWCYTCLIDCSIFLGVAIYVCVYIYIICDVIYTVLSISINPALQPNRQFQGSRVPGFRSGCHGRQKAAHHPQTQRFFHRTVTAVASQDLVPPKRQGTLSKQTLIPSGHNRFSPSMTGSSSGKRAVWNVVKNVRWRKQTQKEGSLRNSSPSKVQSQDLRLKLWISFNHVSSFYCWVENSNHLAVLVIEGFKALRL